MEKKTIVLGTYGKTREHLHGECMDALQHELGVLVLSTRESSHIDVARSFLASTALDMGADVVVFIDHDMLFDPLDVEVLAERTRETRGVIGAAYSMRKMGAGLVGSFKPDTPDAIFFEGGGLYEAAGALGMGFTAIHREVFEKINKLPDYPQLRSQEGSMRPYFQKITVDGYWLKEDASFCHIARLVGAPLHVDTRFRVKHQGEHWFGIEDCRHKSVDEPTLKVQLNLRS